jgi:hypothetical protein
MKPTIKMRFEERCREILNEIAFNGLTPEQVEKRRLMITEARKKTLSKVKAKPGKMHKLLGVPEDKTILDAYKSPKKLIADLMKATKDDYKKVKGMLAFAANISKEKNLFDDALRLIGPMKSGKKKD